MATITPTFTKLRGPAGGIDAMVVTWAGLIGTGDVGAAIQRPDLGDRSAQVVATWGGGTVVVEGSNDGTNWFTLTSPAGTSLSFTANGLLQVTEAVAYIRPHVTSAVTTATITMTLRRTMR